MGDLPANVRALAVHAAGDVPGLTLLIDNLADCDHEIVFAIDNTAFLVGTTNNSVTGSTTELELIPAQGQTPGVKSFDLVEGGISLVDGAGCAVIWRATDR